MKKSHVLMSFFLMLSIGSSVSCNDEVKEVMEGTYCSTFGDSIYENTYTKGFDTLRIFKQTAAGSETYQVDRSMKVTKIIDGVEKPVEHKQESWTGTYNTVNKTLYIENTGRTIAFDIKNKLVKIDSKSYKKIEKP